MVRTLPAGAAVVVSLPVTTPNLPHDLRILRGTFVVYDANGERARAAFDIPVRDGARELEIDAPAAEAPSTSAGDAAPENVAGAAFAVRLVLEPVPPNPPVSEPEDFRIEDEPAPAPVEFSMRLDAARLDEIARFHRGLASGGLVGDLFALRLFFPDPSAVHDAGLAEALADVGDRLRDVFDRLFVKLRIPGFVVCCDDVEDAPLRAALVALMDRLDAGVDDGMPPAFAAAPLGAPVVLRALTALLPSRCDDEPRLAAALGRHAALLDDALGRYVGAPLELFDEALAHRSEPALDTARAAIIDVLHPHLAATEVAC
jgi:hypothetical protein